MRKLPRSPDSSRSVASRFQSICHANSRFISLAVALSIFWLALDSPLDVLAAHYLFSAYMLQNLLLLLVIPPLLLAAWGTDGEPDARSLCNCRPKDAGLVKRALRNMPPRASISMQKPIVSWLAGVGAMWLWHVPVLCSAATSNSVLRSFQALSLVGLGSLFWLPILGPRSAWRLAPLPGIFYLFTACVACTLLGIFITFAPISVCPIYLHALDPRGVLALVRNSWGMTPEVDQQIGGLLMWVPACLVYLCGILGLLVRWYTTAGAESQPGIAPRAEPKPA